MPFKSWSDHQTQVCSMNYFDSGPSSFITDKSLKIGSKSWENTPGFRRKNRKMSSNPFSFNQTDSEAPHGVMNYHPTGEPEKFHLISGAMDQYTTWFAGHPSALWEPALDVLASAAVDAASDDALKKAKNQTVNFAQNLGEVRSTAGTPGSLGKLGKDLIEGIGKNVGDLIDLTLLAKKGDAKGLLKKLDLNNNVLSRLRRARSRKAALKGLSDAWLTWQYGVKPVLNDIYEAAKLIAERNNPTDFVHRVRGTSSSSSSNMYDVVQGLGDAQVVTFLVKTRVAAKVSLEFEIDDNFVHQMSSFGISNAGHLAYELLPLSFVLDWVYDIGTFLSLQDAPRGLVFKRGTISTGCRRTTTAFSGGGSSSTWVYSGSVSSKHVETRLTRAPLGGFPTPAAPVLKNPTSLSHATSAIALFVQRFGKGVR